MEEEENKTFSDKVKDTISDIKDNNKMEEVYEYSRSNIGETATYVGLTVGLLLTLFGNFYGLPIIGFVFGIYFAKAILTITEQAKGWFEEAGLLKSCLIGASLLALFIQSPMFFVGIAGAVILRKVVLGIEDENGSGHNPGQN